MYWAISRYVAVLCIAFLLGWQVQGWRLNGQAATLQAAHAQAILDAEIKARKTERTITAAAQDARKVSDVKIKKIRTTRDTALDRVRDTASNTIQVPEIAGVGTSTPGTELAERNAEFLIRYAADAAELEVALQQCQAAYNQARTELNKE